MAFQQKSGSSIEAFPGRSGAQSYISLPIAPACVSEPQQLEKTTGIFTQNQSHLEAVDHMKSKQDRYTQLFFGDTWRDASAGSVWCCFANNCLLRERFVACQERRKAYWFWSIALHVYLERLRNNWFQKLVSDESLLLMYCLVLSLILSIISQWEQHSAYNFFSVCLHPAPLFSLILSLDLVKWGSFLLLPAVGGKIQIWKK